MKSILICLLGSSLVAGISCTSQSGDKNVPSPLSGEVVADSQHAVVSIESGKIAGFIEDGLYIYKGIPYAQADRFMPPHPVAAWDGIKSTRAYGPVSPQGKRWGWMMDEMAFTSDWDDGYASEDCLRLNIWTQGLEDGKKRPVMVWLHGGGYSAGSGQELPAYDGARLCKKGDVVIVSLNHRLNVLGFLDLSGYGEKYSQSGNVGMLDIVAALKWVKSNIGRFGGDPSNVTIFGQSGGGGKVSTLLAMPSAEGLFHKAIVQSGSMLETMESNYSRMIAQAVVAELKLKPSEVDELAKVPYADLLAAGDKAIQKIKQQARQEGYDGFLFGWAPTVDGKVLPRQPFLPNAPDQATHIPLIIGTTLHEFMGSRRIPGLAAGGMDTAKMVLQRKYGNQAPQYLDLFAKAYPHHTVNDLFDTDLMFRAQAVKQGALKAMQGGAPVYMYLFCWESPMLDGALRSSHCMELPFVFDNVYRSRYMTGGGPQAYELARKMSDAWINFAKTGVPSAAGLPEWKPFTEENGATMLFNDTCEVTCNHDNELLKFISAFQPDRL